VAYEKWFIRKPELLNQEMDAFTASGVEFKINEEKKAREEIIVFQGRVDINGRQVKLELVYPAEFPHFPIVVFAEGIKLPRHQHPYLKNLCVIPHNQDGWDPVMTGAYMVRQAMKLLADSDEGPQVVAAHEVDAPEPWSNYLSFNALPVYISADLPKKMPRYGTFKIVTYPGKYVVANEQGSIIPHKYHALELLTGLDLNYEFPKPFIFQENRPLNKIPGYWFKFEKTPDFNLYNATDLLAALESQFPDQGKIIHEIGRQIKRFKHAKPILRKDMSSPYLAIMFPEENFERGQYRTTFLLGIYEHENDGFTWSQPQFFSVDEHFKRIPAFAPLYYKSVVVVGVGSLGSAIALELGKCGVGDLTLVDHDSLDFGNLSRHTGSFEFLSVPKTLILRHQIRSHFPFSEVKTVHAVLGNVVPNGKSDGSFDKVYELIKDVDLVIDATADARVTRVLNRLAVDAEVSIVHTWISNGAWGGHSIRS
jgi:hypothetical protein